MNQGDRDFLSEHNKRLDDRYESLVTLLTTEFERVNNHLSKLNNRITKNEDQTIIARWCQRNQRAAIMLLLGTVIIFVLVANISNIGEIIRMWLFKI